MQCQGNRMGQFASLSAFVAYQLVLHKLTTSGQFTPVLLSLALLPFVAGAVWTSVIELGLRRTLLGMPIVALVAVAAASCCGLPDAAFMLGLPHLTANLFLLWFFARTLKPSREPLITTIARRLSAASLTAELERYTRRVTVAWSLFFALQIVISLALYAFGSLAAWSTFINVLNGPAVALMFVGEYGYRVLRFRDVEHSPLLAGLDIFSCGPAAAKAAKAR
ncbi:MAG TPA: hypothetical protein VFK88_10050 [Gallionella sp.]|nr:hypothetical protein [Gallionella sp.]